MNLLNLNAFWNNTVFRYQTSTVKQLNATMSVKLNATNITLYTNLSDTTIYWNDTSYDNGTF